MIDSRSFIQLPITPLPALGAFVSSQRLPTCHQQNEIEEDTASGSTSWKQDDDDEDDPSDYSDMDVSMSVPDFQRVLAHRASMKKFKDMRPALQDWMRSWSEKKIPDVGWLNVCGYCNKDKGYGGYGVVLRDNWARPITAATCLRTRRGSQFFQVLSGLKMSLGLAIKYGCLRLIVGCTNLKDLRAQLDKSQFVGFSMIDRDENEPAHSKRLPLKESKVIRPAEFPRKLEKLFGMMLLTVTPDILTNSGY
ncbi:hypothetical protein MKW92_010936 [Papaver armeniacum]|nr:hypothetical protein MKW92_010936 [Papaver armeniacum]